MVTVAFELEIEAAIEVTRPPYADECVALHPGLACSGYPHITEPEEGTS